MPFTRIASHDETLLRRMCAEWSEMPGMRLTTAQAARLWALDRTVCKSALAALVQSCFLIQTRDGVYLRRADHEAA